jgi:outer membrane protein OmpA-like peptidoglycan-associated protein
MKKQVIFLLSISVLTFGQGKTRLPNPINTPKTIEYAPSVTADGQTLVYQSDQFGLFVNSAKKVPKIDAEGKTAVVLDEFETNFFGVYEAKLHPSGTWMQPKQIAAINEYANENMTPVMGGPSISYDGNTLFFFANFGKSGFGREDIYFSERTKSGWTKPENVGSNINTDNYEGFPSISPDGKRLYFTREILGKKVDNKQCYKIMVSEKGRNGNWRLPYELPSPVNLDCEKAPRILADGKTMVFSSIKKEGRGDFDLYNSTMLDNGGWSEPLNLEFINSKKSDLFVSVSPCGDLMYYVSDGDIFTTTIPESLRPIKSATIQGFVLDSITKAPLSTKVVVKENETGNILSVLDNNPSDGRYTAIVPFGKSYNLSVNIPQYFTKTINLDGEQIKDCEPIPLDFKLQIIPTNKEEIVKLALETNRDKVVVDQVRLDAEKQKQELLALEKKQKEEQDKLRLESERLALEKQKAEQLVLEKKQKEEQEKLRLESERLGLEKQKAEQLALEKKQKEEQEKLRIETERLALEKQKAEQLVLEKKQKEEQEKLSLESERLALEKQKAEQLALEKMQKEEQEKLRIETERLALEKQKQEQLALEKKQKAEQEKLRIEGERLALEKQKAEQLALEKKQKEEQEKLRIEGERLALEKQKAEQLALEKKQKEEQEKLRLETERLALEKQKQEQLALEKKQKEEQEKLRIETERLALEKQKQEQLALEKKQKEEQEKLRLESERLALEKQKAEQLALEKKQKEKQEKLRLESERLALEKQKAEQLALEKKQKEEQEKLRIETERLALEKQKQEQLALEKKQKEEQEKLDLEKKRWADSGLTITLLDINTNLPIDGTVVIYRKNNKDSSAYSIKNGTLRIPIAENDTWRIKASAPNYNSIEQVIKIEVPKDASKNFTLELKLEKEVYKIELFAIDLNTTKPIVDAKFVILDFQNKKIVELKADPKGFASFTLPQKGKYTVQLSAPNYKDDEQVINDVKLNTKVTFKPIEIKIPLHELKLFVYDRFTEEELFPDVTSNTKAIGLAPAFIKGPEKTVFDIDLKGENIKPEKYRLAFVDSLINKVSCNLLAQKLFYEFEFRFYDKKTKKPIVRLEHKIIDSDTKSEVQRFSAGKNLALFAPEKSYVFVLNNPNYEPITQKINALDWIKEREFERNIFLNPITQEVAKVEPKVEKVISTKTFGDITKGKKITLENIYFDQSSPVLREESFTQLDELVTVLKDNPDLKIEVRGHTDNVGDLFENVKLSKERCESVINYLTKKGITQTRMVPVGRGPVEPVATNNTEEGRKQNRRVEFVVL